MEQKSKHYLLDIDAAFPREDSVLDEDTMGRLDDAKIPFENYEKLVEWIRAREGRLNSRSTLGSSSRDPNAMVYAVGEGPSQYEIHMLEASSASPDSGSGSSQRSASPWTSQVGAQDPWQGAEDPWETPQGLADTYANQDIDAFGKGKGKPGPLECYNYLGKGHPARVCTSPQGAGKGGAAKCTKCHGKDHTAAMCPSKGGGKYSPPPLPCKGKGYGGKGKVYGKGKGFGKGKQGFSALQDGWLSAEACTGKFRLDPRLDCTSYLWSAASRAATGALVDGRSCSCF